LYSTTTLEFVSLILLSMPWKLLATTLLTSEQ